MSQENVEVVRRATEAGDRDGFAAALLVLQQACDEDVEWVEDPSWPGGGTYRGLEAVRAALAERTDSFDFDSQTEELLDAGDEDVVALVRLRGRLLSTEADMRMAVLFTLHAGKIIRVRFYLDRDEALKAAGLTE